MKDVEKTQEDYYDFQVVLHPNGYENLPYIAKVHYEDGELKETPLPIGDLSIKTKGPFLIREEDRKGNYHNISYQVIAKARYQLRENDVLNLHGNWQVGTKAETRVVQGTVAVMDNKIVSISDSGKTAMGLCVETYCKQKVAKISQFTEQEISVPDTVKVVPANFA